MEGEALTEDELVSGTSVADGEELEQAPAESVDAELTTLDSEGISEPAAEAQAPAFDVDAALKDETVLARLLNHPEVHSRINQEAHKRKLADEPILRQQLEAEIRQRVQAEMEAERQRAYERDLMERDPEAYVERIRQREAEEQRRRQIEQELAPQFTQKALQTFWLQDLQGKAEVLQGFGTAAVEELQDVVAYAARNNLGSNFVNAQYAEIVHKYRMERERLQTVERARQTAQQNAALVADSDESPAAMTGSRANAIPADFAGWEKLKRSMSPEAFESFADKHFDEYLAAYQKRSVAAAKG
jgi:hypothetical protein